MKCLESLRHSDGLDQRQELKKRIKEAERGGNVNGAMALMKELQQLERGSDRV
jgi:hypothetical protein